MAENKEKKVLNVPNLRFPEFEGEWEKTTFGNIATGFDYGMNAAAKSYDGENKYIRITDINESSSTYDDKDIVSPDGTLSDNYQVKERDILLARTGASTGKTYLYRKSDGKLYYAGFLIRANVTTHNPYFVFSQLHTHRYWRWVSIMSARSGQPGINSQEYSSFPVFTTSIQEENKIAKLLSLLDERISTQNKIIDKLQSLIKGIMVELQKQGQNKGNWRNVLLSKVLKERDERNTNLYQVFSVSVSQGVINQVDYLGRSYAARDTSKYNVVHYGDLVYTKSPTGAYPYGIVKQNFNQENVAVSPLYGVYIPNSLSVGTYLHEYFRSEINTHNYLHPLIQKGAKNTINITNQRFLENSVPIPVCANELLLISKLLLSFNDKIKYQQSILQQYQKQKQYLLRQMFI